MTARDTETTKKTRPGKRKPASPDTLGKPGRKGEIELSEDELKDVSGGNVSWK